MSEAKFTVLYTSYSFVVVTLNHRQTYVSFVPVLFGSKLLFIFPSYVTYTPTDLSRLTTDTPYKKQQPTSSSMVVIRVQENGSMQPVTVLDKVSYNCVPATVL